MAISTVTAGSRATVEQHEVVDIVVADASAIVDGNPFDAEFGATLRGPSGQLISVPGFYDLDQGYTVRISLPVEGGWRVSVGSGHKALDAAPETVLTCASSTVPARRGPLRVDPDYPNHVVVDGGDHVYLRGYEVNWLLNVDGDDRELTRVRAFLDSITAAGFTMVTINAYAHSFRQYVSAEHDDDPRYVVPVRSPWIGGNADPDYGSFDPTFFAHVDQVIDELLDRGVIAHLMIHVYNKDVNWPELGSPDDDRYWRYVVARYQAFSNILWDTAKESYFQEASYIWSRIATVRRHDGYRRLLTVHDANPPYAADWGGKHRRSEKELTNALADVVSDQVLHDVYADAYRHVTRDAQPYINIEYGYESGVDKLPSDNPDHDQHWHEVTRRTWLISMGGGYTNYYYRNTAWSLFIPFPEPPGYAAQRIAQEFWTGTSYWRLVPDNAPLGEDRPDNVYCRAEIGREYVVYAESGADFTLTVQADTPLSGHWLHPHTGERHEIGGVTVGTHTFSSPWGDGEPAALHLTQH